MTTTFITGAGRGLGLEFAKQCLARGDRVFAGVRNRDNAEALDRLESENESRFEVVTIDVGDRASIGNCAAALESATDHIDLVINNAGINSMSHDVQEHQRNTQFGALEPEGILEMMRINAVGPALVTQRLSDLLKAADGGKVVFISSWLSSMTRKERGGNYAYCASKAALNMLGHTIAMDMKGSGVTCLLFNPGWVQTDMGGEKAKLTPTESVAGILKTAAAAGIEDSGRFLQWDGTEHPW